MFDSSSYFPIHWSRSFPGRLQGLTGFQVFLVRLLPSFSQGLFRMVLFLFWRKKKNKKGSNIIRLQINNK